MRGVDYRVLQGHGDTQGIALFIMTRFDTQRAFIQGLGRVGRYGEEERRFVLEGLMPVSSLGE